MEYVVRFLFRVYDVARMLPTTELAVALVALLIVVAFGCSFEGLWI